MYAIIAAGGRQYRVSQGDVIYIDKVNQEADSAISFDVLMIGGDGDVKVGNPVLAGAKVEGKVLAQVKGEKITVYKYKSKKPEDRPPSAVHQGGNHRDQGVMISATLYRGKDGLTACRITGHSGQAEAGRDIVCAAVSILGCTCVNALESVCGIIPLVTENEEGLLAFQLPEITPEENAKAQILMGALKQGLTDLADAYPRNVTLTIQSLSH